jgi:predicted component of viral defense system (DUF524 family)
LALLLSICFLLLITVWVTPENQLAELALRGSSVLTQDFRGPQMGFSLRQSRTAQFACISRLISVLGEQELEFEVEVFPTKLDYQTDYQQLLSEVQDILTSLVLEYLRSTFQIGSAIHAPQPTHLEWLTLLRHVLANLERGLQNIARQPVRAAKRTPEIVRSDRIRRIDSQLRRQVLRQAGTRQLAALSSGIEVREQLIGMVARSTLDTPEHRWLAVQLGRIRRRLAELSELERKQDGGIRRAATVDELGAFERRVSQLLRLEPLKAAAGEPPPGFASMQLLGSPGYREAYKCCLIVSLALRLNGGPIRLAVKDLSLLYEYWCYLSLVKLMAELTGQRIPVRDLLAVEQNGLRVLLQKGKEKTVPFEMRDGRHLALTYNPRFQNEPLLVAQQPDIVLSIFDRNWPKVRIVVDAKYRVENSEEYVARYRSPGPPDDAINVLHRYRDAILDADPSPRGGVTPRRTVVEGIALFPYRERTAGAFRQSRLWESINRLGIGAIPALPGEIDYLREWLGDTLRMGGWSIADKAIPHRSHERIFDWRVAASEAVLIGILRGENEREHLDWIEKTGQYYVRAIGQLRQYSTRYVALYIPASVQQPGGVAYWAAVLSINVVKRSEIDTPWTPRSGDQPQVLYKLEPLRPLRRPVGNLSKEGLGNGPRSPWWTSRLALLRASSLQELLLETEPEWRLYEDLQAVGSQFEIEPSKVRRIDPDDPRGRAVFVVGDTTVQCGGATGFAVRRASGEDLHILDTADVLAFLRNRE